MQDGKNLWLAIVLSIAVLVGWQFLMPTPEPPPETQQQAQQQSQQAPGGQAGGQGTTGAPSASGQAGSPTPGQGSIAPGAAGLTRAEAIDLAPRVRIDTPRLEGSINLKGARLDDLTLKDYRESTDEDSPRIDLLHPAGGGKPYFAQFGWAAGQGTPTPDSATVWQADGGPLAPNSPVTLTWDNGEGLVFEQVYEIDRDYMITVTQRVRNTGDSEATVSPYGLVSRTGTPEVLGFYILHEGLIGVLQEGLEEIDYSDVRDEKTPRVFETTGGWMGITDKYWLVSLVPDQSQPVEARYLAAKRGNQDLYQVDFLSDGQYVAPGGTAERTSRLFAGAKETKLLDQYRENLGIINFDLAVDFGWFYFLTKPIFLAIHWLHGILGNFGLAILALTLGIKIAFFPLANKSYRSMSKMKLLQPKMQELKEKYGDDRAKMNQELMEMYKREKVNPLSGCLPIVVQIPVFFALYKVLFVTIEMRHAPFYGWIEDLSARDPLGLLTGFGLVDWQVPQMLDVVNIGLLPIIMGFTMWLQQRLNPAPSDPIQQKIFTYLPIVFTFLLAQFPAGLVLYWTWNNMLSILQQYVIMRRMGVAVGGGKAESSAGGTSG